MYEGGISIENHSAGAGRDVTSVVDNEQLNYTATLPLDITSESAVSRTNLSALLHLNFMKKKIIPCCSIRKDVFIDVSITNLGLILTKLR